MHAVSVLKQHVRNFFYSPETYASVAEGRLSDGVKYVLVRAAIVLIIPLVWAAPVYIRFVTSDFVTSVKHLYPADLVVTIKDGTVSVNQQQPYRIPSPLGLTVADGEKPIPAYLVTIDTTRALDMKEVNAYNSWVVLGTTTLYAQNDGATQAYDISSVKDFTVSKTIYDAFIDDMTPYAYVVLVLLPFVIGVFGLLFLSVYLALGGLIGALAVLIVANIRKVPLSYGSAYLTALFAGIPMALYGLIANALSLQNFWVSALVFLVIVWVNIVPLTPKGAD